MTENHIDPEILEEAKKRMIWMTYKGKEILYDDYRNLQASEFSPLVNAIFNMTLETGKTNLLVIVDVTDSYANKEAVEAFNIAAKGSKEIIKKTAVLGITALKKIFLNVVNKFSKIGARPFNSIEEAKEWLIEEL